MIANEQVQKDFLDLIHIFDSIEEFDMWVPIEHSTLAYVLDKLSGTDEYENTINQWKKLAKEGKYNDLARSIVDEEEQLIVSDEKATEKEKWLVFDRTAVAKRNYEKNRLCCYGYIPERLTPDWFWKLYGEYMPLEVLKRENDIIGCCMEEDGMTHEEAHNFYLQLKKYYDFMCDFRFYARNRRLRRWDRATVRRKSAQDIMSLFGCSPLQAYKRMLYMREHPDATWEQVHRNDTNAKHKHLTPRKTIYERKNTRFVSVSEVLCEPVSKIQQKQLEQEKVSWYSRISRMHSLCFQG